MCGGNKKKHRVGKSVGFPVLSISRFSVLSQWFTFQFYVCRCLFPTLGGNGYVYGVVWRFEARTCQTVTKFIKCTALKISTICQIHYTRCCVPVLSIRCQSVRWGSHTLWQVLVCASARATCQCVWMRRVRLFVRHIHFLIFQISFQSQDNSPGLKV